MCCCRNVPGGLLLRQSVECVAVAPDEIVEMCLKKSKLCRMSQTGSMNVRFLCLFTALCFPLLCRVLPLGLALLCSHLPPVARQRDCVSHSHLSRFAGLASAAAPCRPRLPRNVFLHHVQRQTQNIPFCSNLLLFCELLT